MPSAKKLGKGVNREPPGFQQDIFERIRRNSDIRCRVGIRWRHAGDCLQRSGALVGTSGWYPIFDLFIPGPILGGILGGSQLVAALALLRRRNWALLMAAIAGFGMMIWIFIELAIVGYSWLQSVYVGLGALDLILFLALLGIAPGFASPGHRNLPAIAGPVGSGPHEASHLKKKQRSRASWDADYFSTLLGAACAAGRPCLLGG